MSNDPDGSISTYKWTQISGSSVTLSNDNKAELIFISPEVQKSGENLIFELTVTDNEGAFDTDDIIVHIKNVIIAGDIDDNKKLDLKDVILTLRIISQLKIAIENDYSDTALNEKDKIGLKEAIYLLQMLKRLK
jgi:hypothetical protein